MSNRTKNFRQRRTSSSSSSSSSSSDNETETKINDESNKDSTQPQQQQQQPQQQAEVGTKIDIKEKIEELKFLQKQRQRTHGIDVYSLAIGELDSSLVSVTNIDNDPWKIKTGGLVDMKRIKEKRGNEIVKNMHSNFAKETNQRDEDAEMQKFIEEQLRLKKESEKSQKEQTTETTSEDVSGGDLNKQKFKKPDDALFDVPKYLIENKSKHKSEESLSEQMLSGIPEVDLGIEERIRNIEDTERAKQSIKHSRTFGTTGSYSSSSSFNRFRRNENDSTSTSTAGGSSSSSLANAQNSQYAPHNTSINFVQHKRFDDALINPDHMIKPRMPRPNTVQTQNQPVVGDAPKHELLQQSKINQSNSNTKRYHAGRGANTGNNNARRKYYVSTNMHESTEATDISTSSQATTTTASTSSATASGLSQHKAPHKRPYNNNNNNGNAAVEKASDDYCLERFKKNMRFSRNSKIKIC